MSARWAGRLLLGLGAGTLLTLGSPGLAGAIEPVPVAPAPPGAAPEWVEYGQPNRLVIVRAAGVDSLQGGRLVRQEPRRAGVVTPAVLARSVPDGWITVDAAATRISAAVGLDPGVQLDLGGGPAAIQLTGGPGPADAASLHVDAGQLTATGVTVSSVDPATGQPMPPGPGRPFVSVSAGGRLDAADATFSDLGTPPVGPGDQAGVEFEAGSTGSMLRSTVLRGSTGLRLDRSSAVRLESVQVAESAGDGLVLLGDRGTTLTEVRADRNGGDGVLVTGDSTDRPITGLTTTGNKRYGLTVEAQAGPRITGVVTQADGLGGLRLSGGTDVVVNGFSAIDEPIGVLAHLGSTRAALDDLRITGGGRGLVVEKTAAGLVLTGSRIDHTEAGVSIGGQNTEVRNVQISDCGSGLRIERGANDVTVSGVRITGGADGVVALPGTTGVAVRDLVTERVANYGVRTASPHTRIIGGRISGSETGIAADAATTINGTEIAGAKVGIMARAKDPVAAESVVVSASTTGIVAGTRGPVTLAGSQVRAPEAVSGPVQLVGSNDLSLPALNTLGLIGGPLVLLALVLDQVQRYRQRRVRRAWS